MYPLSSDLKSYIPWLLPKPLLIAIFMSHHKRLGSESLLSLLDKNLIFSEIIVHLIVPQTTLEMGKLLQARCDEERNSDVTKRDHDAKRTLNQLLERHKADTERAIASLNLPSAI